MTRREWLRTTIGALLAAQVPLPELPTLAPVFPPSVYTAQFAELNGTVNVTRSCPCARSVMLATL